MFTDFLKLVRSKSGFVKFQVETDQLNSLRFKRKTTKRTFAKFQKRSFKPYHIENLKTTGQTE